MQSFLTVLFTIATTLFLVSDGAAPQGASGEAPPRPRRVALLVYPGIELLDFAGPAEVFASARDEGRRAFEPYTVAASKEPLRSMGFVELTPQYTFEDCPTPDLIVVPGGSVPLDDARLRAWLVASARSAELVMSVCNGAVLLGSVGLLDGLEATTHHGSLARLATVAPRATVYANRRFVDNGHVLTSAGVSAGIDGALQVVTRLVGEDAARETARYMEYDWRPEELARLHAEPGVKPADELAGLLEHLHAGGLEAGAAWYRGLAEAPDEARMNRASYALMSSGRTPDALLVLRLVAELFPASANACDSLSDALERQGTRDEALAWARRALERLAAEKGLDAARRRLIENAAASRVARLTGDHEALRYACPPCGGACDALRYVMATRCPTCSMDLVERP